MQDLSLECHSTSISISSCRYNKLLNQILDGWSSGLCQDPAAAHTEVDVLRTLTTLVLAERTLLCCSLWNSILLCSSFPHGCQDVTEFLPLPLGPNVSANLWGESRAISLYQRRLDRLRLLQASLPSHLKTRQHSKVLERLTQSPARRLPSCLSSTSTQLFETPKGLLSALITITTQGTSFEVSCLMAPNYHHCRSHLSTPHMKTMEK